MRRKKKDLCDLTQEEYKDLKAETDARIAVDYAPGNIVSISPGALSFPTKETFPGICFFDVFIDNVTGKQCVMPLAIATNGHEVHLGYNTFETIKFTGETASIDEWVKNNVSERAKRKKRNT